MNIGYRKTKFQKFPGLMSKFTTEDQIEAYNLELLNALGYDYKEFYVSCQKHPYKFNESNRERCLNNLT